MRYTEDEGEIGVGFTERDGGEVRWITVGRRCARCGVLGSPVEWAIDYVPMRRRRAPMSQHRPHTPMREILASTAG